MKKILVTGASGFIGSHLLNYINNNGYRGIGWGRTNSKDIKNIDFECHDELVNALVQDKPDMVIHCAGSADVSKSVINQKADFSSNVICTYNLLQAIKDAQLKPTFLFLSSAAVYGNPSRLPVDENADMNPLSPYALHKIMAEDICRYFSKHYDIPIKIARIFSAYGRGLKKQIFWDMNNKLNDTGEINLFGSGNETRDYIHINDIVKALLLITTSDSTNTVFNVANGEETTIKKAAENFVNAKGLDPSIISFNGVIREGDPLYWKADISRLKKLGYEPDVKFSDGISDYVTWLNEI